MKTKYFFTLLFLASTFIAKATSYTIHFGDTFGMKYSPDSLVVNVGDTVIWEGDFSFHPLESTSLPNGVNAINVTSGTKFTFPIAVAGDYRFKCSVHQFQGLVRAIGQVGVQKNAMADWKIFPTVTRDMIIIRNPQSGSAEISISVFNAAGILVKNIQVLSQPEIQVDLRDQSCGTYLVMIKSGNLVQTERIVLN